MIKGKEMKGKVKTWGGRLVVSEIDCTIITRLFGDFDNIRLFFAQGTRLMENFCFQWSIEEVEYFAGASYFDEVFCYFMIS